MFDVFVSYKSYNIDGSPTIEHQLAQMLAERFAQTGIRAFFSEGSYRRAVQPSYGSTVDSALTSSRMMLVLAADPVSVSDRWVEYEWRYYSNAVNSGVMPGCLMTVLHGVTPYQLPPALANVQPIDSSYIDYVPSIVADVLAQLMPQEEQPVGVSQSVLLAEQYIPTDATELDLSERGITDISELVWLRALQSLKLSGNHIADITALSALRYLVSLDLSSNRISDISPLGGLGMLRTLELWNNRISDLSPLGELAELKTLRLWRNRVSDLSPIGRLDGLETLELAGNRISDLSPLADMHGLVSLELGGNDIEDITPLESLTGLRTLWLNNNRISDLSALAGMSRLETLHLEGNALITDLTPLYDMPSLSMVWISGCPGISAEAALDLRYEKTDCAVIFD